MLFFFGISHLSVKIELVKNRIIQNHLNQGLHFSLNDAAISAGLIFEDG
jgi:hypothetical protein